MNLDSDLIRIPPFVDSHIHFVKEGRAVSPDGLVDIVKSLLKHGIFAVMDMGYKTGIGLTARRILSEGGSVIPLIIKSAGFAIYRKGTYGVFLGRGVIEKDDIKKTVGEIADAGADYLKVVNSGVVCTRKEGFVTPGGFPIKFLKAICDEAKNRNLPVVCHANGDEAIRHAIIAGASSIEHGFFISKESIHLMVEKGISWTPTIFALSSITSTLRPSEARNIEKVVEGHLEAVNYGDSIGAKLRIGTDSGSKGVRHGESFFDELGFFKKAGIAFDKILSYACLDSREAPKDSYLMVRRDFIESRKIEAVYYDNKEINQLLGGL